MKKILLLLISLLLGTFIQAQNNNATTSVSSINLKRIKPISISNITLDALKKQNSRKAPKSNLASVNKTHQSQSSSEETMGNTAYDVQTVGSIPTRLIAHADGTISATWNFIAPGGTSSSAGIGYNYFNATNWNPIPSLPDTTLKGFSPCLAITASNKEFCYTRDNLLLNTAGITQNYRSTKGLGPWSHNYSITNQNPFLAPKAIAGGANGESIHLINTVYTSVTTSNQTFPLLYSRSLDGGLTWTLLNIVIPGIDSSFYKGFGVECYSIDAVNDTIAIVIGTFTTDLILLKSTDNGTTWTKTIIQSFPIPMYDGLIDSLAGAIEVPSGDAHVMLDNNGKAHVFWSNTLLGDSSAIGQAYTYPNATNALYYWNEGFGPGVKHQIASANDMNGDGILNLPVSGFGGTNGMGTYIGGITQNPSSGVDANNDLYVTYQSYCENCDTTAFSVGHKHSYLISSIDGGSTWSCAYDIDQKPDMLNQEDVYPCMAKNIVNNKVQILYQRDGAPGNSMSTNTNESGWNSAPSDIICATIDLWPFIGIVPNCIFTGLSPKAVSKNSINLYPNPSNDLVNLNFTVEENTLVNLELKDMLGKTVYKTTKQNFIAGEHTLSINTNELANGIYFCTLKLNDQAISKKLLINH